MSEAKETKVFAARCRCRNISYTVEIRTSDLPLAAHICGCGTCRHTHGTFGAFYVTLPKGVSPLRSNADDVDLTMYDPKSDGHGEMSFCSICGAHHGYWNGIMSQWVLDLALFDKPFWSFKKSLSINSSADGGMLPWLPEKYGNGEGVLPTARTSPRIGQNGEEEKLRAACHCGSISFTILRPNQAAQNDPYMRDYISPKDPRKWKAFLDFCSDCRLLTSAPFVPWMLVPRILIEPEMPADIKLFSPVLKTYESSEGVVRSFCGKCGATVFIKTVNRLPSEEQMILNVGMGILRASEGARAESWVTWRTGKCAFVDDGREFDESLTEAVVDGHQRWGLELYGDAPDFDVI
ncbi:hypothetical protein F5Y16DRAFT_218319 [Xylariaceae sp. FL0255]|nr:hypothetical protein F5Y16DRAFT_218319 [Xylariaceae sp. FL0255]